MRRLVLVGAIAAGLACSGGPPAGRMVPAAPPRGWAGELARERAAKDAQFRTDPQTPLLAADVAGFTGLQYWPPDPRYYFMGPLHAYPQPQRFTITTTGGAQRPCEKVGWIEFELEGRPRRLQVYRLLDLESHGNGEDLFLPLVDATAGEATYPAGRYVELRGAAGGPYVLDFNRAYNPSCAYGDPGRFACPVTPPENRLDARIEAGERGYKHAAGT
ncbi:MAG TPA: DUF1684 domain-containing protein [Candidatus Polarisedimenticolaceae bacterium]|nr:DUF1684 domain-containing protein [Candidatus Polarisedimenticolaceae bacterium]